MEQGCQFREVQRWSRVVSWPLIALGAAAVATFAQDTVDSDFRWIVQTAAIAMIPAGWMLLELAGPTLEVRDGRILYSIWPFYRKEIHIEEVESSAAKCFHPSGNYVYWKRYMVQETHYVELRLRDGSVIDLTTLQPSRLHDAIRRAQAVNHHESRHSSVVSQ